MFLLIAPGRPRCPLDLADQTSNRVSRGIAVHDLQNLQSWEAGRLTFSGEPSPSAGCVYFEGARRIAPRFSESIPKATRSKTMPTIPKVESVGIS